MIRHQSLQTLLFTIARFSFAVIKRLAVAAYHQAQKRATKRQAKQINQLRSYAAECTIPAAKLPQTSAETVVVTHANAICATQPAATEGDRNILVQQLLDEAWMQGLTTYTQLINYVEQHSGQGCSRRAIARWKKARNLIQDAL